MAIPTITVSIDAPSRGAAAFETAMATALANLDIMIDQVNAAISAINGLSWLGTGAPAVVFSLDTGAAEAYVMTPALALTAYDPTKLYLFKAAHANTGASTLAVSGLAAKAIVDQSGAALAANAILAGQEVLLAYVESADKFMLVGASSAAAPAPSGGSKWTALTATTDFATTASSTSTIPMNANKTGDVFPGMGIKFTLSGVDYYAICTAITSGQLTIAGAPLTTAAGALTALSYGTNATYTERIPIPGYWADSADNSLIANDLRVSWIWRGPPAYLVQFGAISNTTDSGTTKPRINVRIGSTTTDRICTANAGAGLEIAAGETWYRTGVNIDPTKYALNFGDPVEFTTDGNGGYDNAEGLKPVEFTVAYR